MFNELDDRDDSLIELNDFEIEEIDPGDPFADPETRQCRVCYAPPGFPCLNDDGNEISPHKER